MRRDRRRHRDLHPASVTRLEEVARAIATASRARPRPIPLLAVLMAGDRAHALLADARVPVYVYPEDAARARARGRARDMARAARGNGTHIRQRTGRRSGGRPGFRTWGGASWLAPDEIARLFECYGRPLAPYRLASSPADAGGAAEDLGGAVALKAIAPTLVHKTEAKGVRLGLTGRTEVEAAAVEMRADVERAGHAVERYLVQAMVAPGVEMLVGMVNDPSFGPVVACGVGGIAVELSADVSLRVTPISDLDAAEMIHSLRTFPLLDGYRGRPRADVAALEDVILRVSAMVDAHPEIAELDCNPVVVHGKGAVIVDARLRVETATARADYAALQPS